MRKDKPKRLSVVVDRAAPGEVEPSAADLAEIEKEWPEIEAGLALLDAEIAVLCAPHGPTDLDWRRLRRVQAGVLRQAAALASHPRRVAVGRAA